MKKSIVSAAVTITFIVYSLYQRTFGIETTPGMAQTVSNQTSVSTQDSRSGNSIPAPTSRSGPRSSLPNRPNPSQTVPGNPPTSTPAPSQDAPYKDGTYTGVAANAFFGNLQVQVTIANGKLTNIQFLQYPNDRSRSIAINRQALPMLSQEAIQAQSANVRIISGATDSSRGFVQSLKSALGKAQG